MFGFTSGKCESGLKSLRKDGGGSYLAAVPLQSVNIHSHLINFCALVKVEQIYVNTETNPIECEFSFPLEESSAILTFKAVLDGRTLTSKVKPNKEAEADYKDAVAEGKTGFLAQATRQDILNIKIGHLSAGASCSITITYITEANLEDGKIRLTIPTTISPKYIPPATKRLTEVQNIANIKYSINSPAPMKFTVKASMKSKIEAMTSPSHNIRTCLSGNNPCEDDLFVESIELEANTADLDRDIVVLVKCESSTTPIVLYEEGEQSKVMMVSLVPNLKLQVDPEYDVVFLVDCSGSMQGSSIKLARDAINILLHSLPHSTHFNIVRFGSSYQKLFPNSVPYTDETLAHAKMNIKHIQADLGGTEILTPLKTLLEEETVLPRRIFVLTDGSVSNSMECLNVTSKFNKKCKVFALGIGSAADRHLVKGLARAGQGTSQFTTEGEIIAPKIIQQLKQCLQPTLSNIKIDWGFPVDESLSCQAPYSVPMLYSGTRIQVFRLVDPSISIPEKITIMADIPSEKRRYSEEVIVNSRPLKSKILHQMFAKKMIQSLEEQEEKEDNDEMKEIITELALKYQLMSKYTSFIAIDSKENKTCLPMQSRNIPNQVPSGFQSCPTFGQPQQRMVLFGSTAPSNTNSGQLFGGTSAGNSCVNTGFSFGAAASSNNASFGNNTSAFGSTNTGFAFGAAASSNNASFGNNTASFGSTNTGFSFGAAASSNNASFGNNTAAFGSTNTGSAFIATASSNNASFGNNTTGVESTNTGFGSNNTGSGSLASGFGSSTGVFGSSTGVFGNSTDACDSSNIGFGSNSSGFASNSLVFGSNSSGFGSNSLGFGSNRSGFGSNSSGFGNNSSGFGSNSSGFGGTGIVGPSIAFGGLIPAHGFNNTGFGNSSTAPGSGAPGFGVPGSGALGSGAPCFGSPGSGAPGSGAPGSGAPISSAPASGFMQQLQDSGNKVDDPMNNVLELISLQTAEGSFSGISQIQKILNLEISEKLNLIDEEVDNKIICTILVIIGLEKKFYDLMSCWELVVEKANNFLSKQTVPDGLYESIHKIYEN